MRKFVIAMFFIAGIVAIGLTVHVGQARPPKMSQFESILSENATALSEREYYVGYCKVISKCTIHVGAGGKVKLLGGTIVKADAAGDITFDGEVTCIAGGKALCSPVECVELYSIIK